MTRSAYLQASLLSSLLFAAFWCIFGFYHETNDDLIYQGLLNGLWAQQPVTDFLNYHLFTANIYAWLYQIASGVEWYAWCMYLLLFWACINSFLAIHTLFLGCKTPVVVAVQLLFFLAAFGRNIVLFNFTRPAILLSGSSIVLLAASLLRRPEGGKAPPFLTVWCFAGLTAAHLTRPEASHLCLLVFMPFAMLLFGLQGKLKTGLAKVLLPSLSIMLFFSALHTITQSKASREAMSKTGYVANIVNAHLWANGGSLSPQDTMVLEAAKRWFFADAGEMDMERLKKLTYGSRFTFNEAVWQRTGERLSQLRKRLHKPANIPILALLAIAIGTAVYAYPGKRRAAIAIIAGFQLWFWLMVLAIFAASKLPARLFYPLLGANLLFCLLAIPSKLRPRTGKAALALGLLAALPTLQPSLIGLWNRCGELEQSGNYNKQLLRQINASFNNKTLVYTLPSIRIMDDLPPLSKFGLNDSNRHVLIQGWASGLPFFGGYMRQLCGTENAADFFVCLAESDDAFFLSEKGAMDFFVQYFDAMHSLQFSYQAMYIPPLSRLLEAKGLKVYSLHLSNP